MFPFTVEEFCRLTGGTVVGDVVAASEIDNVAIDSRLARRGSAFFALQGENAHGIQFAADAVQHRAAVVVTDGAHAADCSTGCVVVPNTQEALTQIARHNRDQSDALIIGVTGSVGKTTTRSMISNVLDSAFLGIQSPGNFNNHLGVPLSLLQLSAGDEFAVIEMGASAPGEIAGLANAAQPDFAVVTRIAPAHLDGFGSLKSVQQAKAELVRSLPADGVAFLNADDNLVRQLDDQSPARIVLFGEAADADIRAETVRQENESLTVCVGSEEFTTPVCGRHHLSALLAAIAVGRELGLTTGQINAGLSQYVPEPGRCCVSSIGPWTVIDDTYNASPASVAAAADTLQNWSAPHARVLVLGDMLELGDQSEEFHYSVGLRLAQSSIDHILTYGQAANHTVEGFRTGGGPRNRISVFEDFSTLLSMLDCFLSPGDVLLVKGSRGMRMERVIAALDARIDSQPTVSLPHPSVNERPAATASPIARPA